MVIIFFESGFAEDILFKKIKQADELYNGYDPKNVEEAARIFEELIVEYPDEFEVLWSCLQIDSDYYKELAREMLIE
ncbi:MAG: hypothetical protein KAX49_05405 [Halanaerobiales bacterium]|nr:hypothetical protein [Halanaerobiales bacterium]